MSDLRTTMTDAADGVEADLVAAVLVETGRRRRRRRTLAVAGSVAAVVLLSAGLTRAEDLLDAGRPALQPARTPSSSGAAAGGPATQPVWDPVAVRDLPVTPSVLTPALSADGWLAPDVAPGIAPVTDDPVAAVVVAWSEKGVGTRLLGTDGRWRSAPPDFESNTGTPYAPDPPAISPDGTRVAVSVRGGVDVLDVTTGAVVRLPWPDALAPPWDWAPDLRWLPDGEGLLVLHWGGPWVLGLDGGARRLEGPRRSGGGEGLAVDPSGTVYENDYRRSTLVAWDDGRAVLEAPFPQCERLVAADGLVACTTGSLDNGSGGRPRSGPVVVDVDTGDVLAYAPVADPASLYSDAGGLTALGFLDPDTVLLRVEPRRSSGPGRPVRDGEPPSFDLLAWRFADGTFDRLASGALPADGGVAVAPALLR